jgi:serine/threonine-protein kinase
MQPDVDDAWAAFPDEPTAPNATSPTGAPSASFTPPPGFTGFVPGMVLADRYRLDRQVGEGGMAVVFEAWDLELDETIALKIFTRELANERSLARFKQEISLSRRIAHPNVVRLYDFGSWHGFRFISMELLDGRDLNSWMGTPIARERGIRWLAQAADGLQAAHDQGVIHRDIKPHNIFICRDDTVKVMDFGIAKRGTGDGVTQGNMLAGTPDYMSPEQIAGFSTVTHTTDLYALGVVAYQMFTGTLPFTHEELVPLLMMHINDPVPPPRERNPRLGPDLERVILRLLEKKPEDRYPSCAALAEVLRSLPPPHP